MTYTYVRIKNKAIFKKIYLKFEDNRADFKLVFKFATKLIAGK